MKSSTKAALAALVCVFTAGSAASQSLTEAAAKEKERRAKTKAGKTYTENELRSAGQGFSPEATAESASEAAGAEGAKPAPGASPSPTAEDERAKKQKEWSDRFQKTETEHRQYTDEITRIQGQLGDSNASQYGPARQRATEALNEAQAKAAELQQKLADLEEEGRRNRYKR